MANSVLSRYLDPDVLSAVADRHFEPRGLVIGNLAGAHKSPLSGFAVEFAGHREYAPGDDPKHIDWRVYFNRDKFVVKQYELETNFVCHLLLDISASMRYGEGRQQKLLYAAQMATTLGYSIVRQSDKVSLATFDTHVRDRITPSNSMDQMVRMAQYLEDIATARKHPYTGIIVSEAGSEMLAKVRGSDRVLLEAMSEQWLPSLLSWRETGYLRADLEIDDVLLWITLQIHGALHRGWIRVPPADLRRMLARMVVPGLFDMDRLRRDFPDESLDKLVTSRPG